MSSQNLQQIRKHSTDQWKPRRGHPRFIDTLPRTCRSPAHFSSTTACSLNPIVSQTILSSLIRCIPMMSGVTSVPHCNGRARVCSSCRKESNATNCTWRAIASAVCNREIARRQTPARCCLLHARSPKPQLLLWNWPADNPTSCHAHSLSCSQCCIDISHQGNSAARQMTQPAH